MTAVDIIPPGWSVTEKYLEILSKLSNREEVLAHLLSGDIREFGAAWLDSKKNKDSLDADGQILQVVHVRNIAISQAEEDFQFLSDKASSGSRLLRLTLTDGKTNVSALDVDNSPKLSSETPPGTKIRLIGKVPMKLGFLILKRKNFDVLIGNVDSLRREWLITRDAKGTRRSNRGGPDGPPPFVAFGTPEASAMIDAHNQFLNSIRAKNLRSDDAFDSLKMALNATTKANVSAAGGDDTDFQQKRREVLAEAQNTDVGQGQHKFKAGCSKFQQARVDLALERDHNVAQLVSMGYQPNEASAALEESNNRLEGAIDRLISRQLGRSFDTRRGSGLPGRAGKAPVSDRGHDRGRGGRGRGGARGGKFDSILEEDPRFDPVAAAERSGLRGKPSQGPVPLSEFMEQPYPQQANPAPGPSSSSCTSSGVTSKHRLEGGTILQARVMSGDYEAAQLVGLLPSRMNGERVAVVKYLNSGEKEEVPVSMLRTLENTEITPDMLPEIQSSVPRNTDISHEGRGGFGGNNINFRGNGGRSRGIRGRSGVGNDSREGATRGGGQRGRGNAGRGRVGGFSVGGSRGRGPRRGG
nr:Ubiquitin associated translation elongation factor EF1B [Hymenolepis microstoma]